VTLKQDLQNTQAQVQAQTAQVVAGSQVVTPVPARSYPNSPAAWEAGTSFDSDVVQVNQTSRAMWQTQPAAVQQNKVNTLNMPTAVMAKGIAISPSVTSAKLVAVPDMAVGIRGTAGTQVQLNWHFAGSLSTSTAAASFALFRDGLQIAPTGYGSSPTNGAKFSFAGTYIDSPTTGAHAYAIYWATNAGTLTADGKGRYLSALLLKPQ
jgi:hypothetical protein